MSELWKEDLYINQNIIYLFNKEIFEYDMKDAGFSLTREFKLLPQETIKKLDKLGKPARKRRLGIYQRDDNTFKENLKIAFKNARKMFFEENNLEDSDIISIKKDAIFTCKRCEYQKFGEYIDFREKNQYSSYIRLGKKLEFYYSYDKLDVKGIGDDEIQLHNDYMLDFMRLYFKKMETDEPKNVIGFTKRFIDRYKAFQLPVGYYRKFDTKSNFEAIDDDTIYMEYPEDWKENLDISFNYFTILLKLIKIPL